MLHAAVKSHRASYRSLAEGFIPSVLPANKVQACSVSLQIRTFVWWRVCTASAIGARQQLPGKVRIDEAIA
jgi:hypothetical protein